MTHTKSTIVAAVIAVPLNLTALAATGQDTPDAPAATVLGFTQGDVIPVDERKADDEHKAMRVAAYPAKAGFDAVAVVYTEKQGVCKVGGYVEVDNARSDSYGHRHKAAADKLVERVTAKVGASPTQRHDFNADRLFTDASDWITALRRGNAKYAVLWLDEDAAPFDAIVVSLSFGSVVASFEMRNFKLCVAEQEAADATAF